MALQDDTFGDLKNLTFALIGREYASTSSSYDRLKSLWNYAAKKAYKASNYWERFLVIGDERIVTNGNTISRTQSTKDSIDTYLRIYKSDPNKTRGGEYGFVVNGEGATITGSASNVSGDLYAVPTSNSFYLQPNSSGSDTTVFVTYKKLFDPNFGSGDDTEAVPSELLPYMAHLAAYTWQRSVDQNASDANFTLSLSLVNSILEDELAKISDQNIANSYIVKNMRTNYNQTII
jgi:hypothetical protein